MTYERKKGAGILTRSLEPVHAAAVSEASSVGAPLGKAGP